MSEKLTPEQIKNWRTVFTGMFGPWAMIMPDEEVQKFRDRMQSNINKIGEEQDKENG